MPNKNINNLHIKFTDTIIPLNNTFPLANINDIKGGVHYVNTKSELDSIPLNRRASGMLCYVIDIRKMYQWVTKTTEKNGKWKVFRISGGIISAYRAELDINNELYNEDLYDIDYIDEGELLYIIDEDLYLQALYIDSDDFDSLTNEVIKKVEWTEIIKGFNIKYISNKYIDDNELITSIGNFNPVSKSVLESMTLNNIFTNIFFNDEKRCYGTDEEGNNLSFGNPSIIGSQYLEVGTKLNINKYKTSLPIVNIKYLYNIEEDKLYKDKILWYSDKIKLNNTNDIIFGEGDNTNNINKLESVVYLNFLTLKSCEKNEKGYPILYSKFKNSTDVSLINLTLKINLSIKGFYYIGYFITNNIDKMVIYNDELELIYNNDNSTIYKYAGIISDKKSEILICSNDEENNLLSSSSYIYIALPEKSIITQVDIQNKFIANNQYDVLSNSSSYKNLKTFGKLSLLGKKSLNLENIDVNSNNKYNLWWIAKSCINRYLNNVTNNNADINIKIYTEPNLTNKKIGYFISNNINKDISINDEIIYLYDNDYTTLYTYCDTLSELNLTVSIGEKNNLPNTKYVYIALPDNALIYNSYIYNSDKYELMDNLYENTTYGIIYDIGTKKLKLKDNNTDNNENYYIWWISKSYLNNTLSTSALKLDIITISEGLNNNIGYYISSYTDQMSFYENIKYELFNLFDKRISKNFKLAGKIDKVITTLLIGENMDLPSTSYIYLAIPINTLINNVYVYNEFLGNIYNKLDENTIGSIYGKIEEFSNLSILIDDIENNLDIKYNIWWIAKSGLNYYLNNVTNSKSSLKIDILTIS